MAEGEVAGPGQQSREALKVQRDLRQEHQGLYVHNLCWLAPTLTVRLNRSAGCSSGSNT